MTEYVVLLMGDAEFVPTSYDQINSWFAAKSQAALQVARLVSAIRAQLASMAPKLGNAVWSSPVPLPPTPGPQAAINASARRAFSPPEKFSTGSSIRAPRKSKPPRKSRRVCSRSFGARRCKCSSGLALSSRASSWC